MNEQDSLTGWFDISNTPALLKYFSTFYQQFCYADNLGIALDDDDTDAQRQAKLLNNLFVLPEFGKRYIAPEQRLSDEAEHKKTAVLSIYELLKQQPQSFVLGDPGSGKSTLFNWLMLSFSYSSDNLLKLHAGALVPFLFVLRNLDLRSVKDWDSLWDIWLQHCKTQQPTWWQVFANKEGKALLEQLLSSGQALILVDGLDEVTHVPSREGLSNALREGVMRYPHMRCLISSRILGFSQQEWLADEKQPMREDKLHSSSGKQLHEAWLAPFSGEQQRQFVSNWYQQYSHHPQRIEQLIEALSQSDALQRLARVPVLLNMICFIHARRNRLPDGRAELYQRIAQTYLVSLEQARGLKFQGKALEFDYEDLSEWLGRLALQMQQDRDEDSNAIVIPESEVLQALSDSFDERGWNIEKITDQCDYLLSYLLERSGLLIPRGIKEEEEHYAFSHLSFLEYFAASELMIQAQSGELEWQDLQEKRGQVHWHETLVLFFELCTSSRTAKRYFEQLFGKGELNLPREADKNSVNHWTLLSQIVLDSAVRLSADLREQVLRQCWGYYLTEEIQKQYNFQLDLSLYIKVLWTTTYDSIAIGLEKMQGVTHLSLPNPQLNDLNFLSNTANLIRLNLDSSGVQDLSPVAALTQLKTLWLDKTNITDLSSLSSLNKLASLSFNETAISDITALANSSQLQKLYLNEIAITDISVLANLSQLQTLGLSGTAVTDISALANLSQLQQLYLSKMAVTDISVLASLSQLQTLDLSETTVTDISPLANLSQLRQLSLSETAVTDISALTGLSKLQHLWLSQTKIQDISVLKQLPKLTFVDLSNTQVRPKDLKALKALKRKGLTIHSDFTP